MTVLRTFGPKRRAWLRPLIGTVAFFVILAACNWAVETWAATSAETFWKGVACVFAAIVGGGLWGYSYAHRDDEITRRLADDARSYIVATETGKGLQATRIYSDMLDIVEQDKGGSVTAVPADALVEVEPA